MKREHAMKLRQMIVKASASLPDEDALNAVELFPAWAVGVEYAAAVRVRYGEKLFRCEQAHTSQADWTPDATPALWTEVAEPGEIPVWKQPTGAQDAYDVGDKVHYPTEQDPIYINNEPANVYAPDVWGWSLWEGDGVG